MVTLIKLAVAGVIGLAMLHPFSADSCQCKASARSAQMLPSADSCQCKANALAK
jgi:hypothetical protein